MKFIKYALVIFLLFLMIGCSEQAETIKIKEASAEKVKKSENAEIVDIVLFLGQSNIIGRGNQQESIKVAEGIAYEYKSEAEEIVRLADPVGEKDKPDIATDGSLIPAFAQSLYDNREEKRPIIAIVNAKGGTSIGEWQDGDYLYNLSIDKLNDLISKLNQDPDKKIGDIYYVFLQGIRDVVQETEKEDYKRMLSKFHESYIEDSGASEGFIIQVGYDYREDANRDINEDIIEAQNELSDELDNLTMISELSSTFTIENGLMQEDGVHYSQEGLNKVGNDAGENLAEYLNR